MLRSFRESFEGWEMAIAKNLLGEFRRRWKCLEQEDYDETLDICLEHYYRVKDKCPIGVPSDRFMSRVIKNKLFEIVKGLMRQKRKISQYTMSLDAPLSEPEGESAIHRASEKCSARTRFLTELRAELVCVRKTLSARQGQIYDLMFKGCKDVEICRQLRLGRKVVRKEKKSIAIIFEAAGLREYF